MQKECRDHLGNIYSSETEMCKVYGIDRNTYRCRIKRGYTQEEALTSEPAKNGTDRMIDKRIGMVKQMNDGHTAKVIRHITKPCSKFLFEFEDGVQKIAIYSYFENGTLSHDKEYTPYGVEKIPRQPRKAKVLSTARKEKIRLKGAERISLKGEKYTVISDDFGPKYKIRFENGIIKEYNRGTILSNSVSSGEMAKTAKKEKIKAVIGEEGITTSMRPCRIIGGTALGNLDVQLSDGRILHGIKYCNFKLGHVREEDQSSEQISRKRYNILGLTVEQNCGLSATCIEYTDCEHVRVKFSNGEESEVQAHQFKKGQVKPPSYKTCNNTSLNEYTLSCILQDAGFKKYAVGSLKHLKGFGNKELDLYNPNLKIAIEYDGPWHKLKQNVKKDKLKDALCRDNGISIYRIREEGVPFLNDGISHEFRLNDNHPFAPEFRKICSELISSINAEAGTAIKMKDIGATKFRDMVQKQFAKKTLYMNRVGEKRLNRLGEEMEILEYINSSKVHIGFQNGYTTWRDISAFNSGIIQCLYNHFGETSVSKTGLKMTIISDKFGQSVDVQFEDGTVVKNVNYCNFTSGAVVHPAGKETLQDKKDLMHIGEITETHCGLLAEIISVNRKRNGKQSQLYVVPRFEDGTIGKPTEYKHFQAGYVKHPTISGANIQQIMAKRKDRITKEWMSRTYMSADGHEYKVIRYHDSRHIRIRFSDGYELNTLCYTIVNNQIYRYLDKNRRRNTIPFDEWIEKGWKTSKNSIA